MTPGCRFCGRPLRSHAVDGCCDSACAQAVRGRYGWPIPGPRAPLRRDKPEPRRFRWQEVER